MKTLLVGFVIYIKKMLVIGTRLCIIGLSEIGAEGKKVQKSKLVTFFLL